MARKGRKAQDELLRADTNTVVSQVDRRLLTPGKVNISRLVRYTIPLPPRPKARARAFAFKSKSTGKLSVGNFTPEDTRTFERRVAEYCAEQHPALVPFSGRLSIAIVFHVSALRGDIDNLAKAVLDGAQGVVFVNDTSIDELWLSRVKVPEGKEKVEMTVRPHFPEGVHFCERCGYQIELETFLLSAEAVPF